MRALVLWADDRSPNLGVRVLGAGTAALVRRVWPDAEIVFHNYSAGTAPVRLGSLTYLGLETVTRRQRLADWFRGFDLVLDTRAGDSFADIYGIHRLASQVAAAEFATRSGVPVVLTPQTIGPFTSRLGRALGRRSLRTAAVVMGRDSISGEAAQRLGRPVDVVATDVVFALPDPGTGPRRDVVLNVSGLLWRSNPHVDAAAYRDTVRQVYDTLRRSGRSVTLLAHVLSTIYHGDDDVPAIEAFAAEHATEAEVLIPESLEEVRQAVAGAELVIGSRMHACLNALVRRHSCAPARLLPKVRSATRRSRLASCGRLAGTRSGRGGSGGPSRRHRSGRRSRRRTGAGTEPTAACGSAAR